MNDLIPGARSEGAILFHGRNIYDPDVEPVLVRNKNWHGFSKAQSFPQINL